MPKRNKEFNINKRDTESLVHNNTYYKGLSNAPRASLQTHFAFVNYQSCFDFSLLIT